MADRDASLLLDISENAAAIAVPLLHFALQKTYCPAVEILRRSHFALTRMPGVLVSVV